MRNSFSPYPENALGFYFRERGLGGEALLRNLNSRHHLGVIPTPHGDHARLPKRELIRRASGQVGRRFKQAGEVGVVGERAVRLMFPVADLKDNGCANLDGDLVRRDAEIFKDH